MPLKRKSGYALSDDEDNANGFGNKIRRPEASAEPTKSAKRSKQATSTSPADTASMTVTHFADTTASQTPKQEDDGTLYWEISKARRVTLSSYSGKKLVGIREYYEKDGQWLPGKKGISMTLEQYGTLISLLPGIESELRKDGVNDVPRPDYDGVAGGDDADVDLDDAGAERGARPNHEATSDEED